MSKTLKRAEDYDNDMRYGRSGIERKPKQHKPEKTEGESYFATNDYAAKATFR